MSCPAIADLQNFFRLRLVQLNLNEVDSRIGIHAWKKNKNGLDQFQDCATAVVANPVHANILLHSRAFIFA